MYFSLNSSMHRSPGLRFSRSVRVSRKSSSLTKVTIATCRAEVNPVYEFNQSGRIQLAFFELYSQIERRKPAAGRHRLDTDYIHETDRCEAIGIKLGRKPFEHVEFSAPSAGFCITVPPSCFSLAKPLNTVTSNSILRSPNKIQIADCILTVSVTLSVKKDVMEAVPTAANSLSCSRDPRH